MGPMGNESSSPTVNSTSRPCSLFCQRQAFPSRWKDMMSGYSSAMVGSRVAMVSHTAGRMWGRTCIREESRVRIRSRSASSWR